MSKYGKFKWILICRIILLCPIMPIAAIGFGITKLYEFYSELIFRIIPENDNVELWK